MLSSVSWCNSTELWLHCFQPALSANACWPIYGKVTLLVQCSGACELKDFCLCVWSHFFVQLVGESKHLPSFMGCSMYLLHLWFSFVKVLLSWGTCLDGWGQTALAQQVLLRMSWWISGTVLAQGTLSNVEQLCSHFIPAHREVSSHVYWPVLGSPGLTYLIKPPALWSLRAARCRAARADGVWQKLTHIYFKGTVMHLSYFLKYQLENMSKVGNLLSTVFSSPCKLAIPLEWQPFLSASSSRRDWDWLFSTNLPCVCSWAIRLNGAHGLLLSRWHVSSASLLERSPAQYEGTQAVRVCLLTKAEAKALTICSSASYSVGNKWFTRCCSSVFQYALILCLCSQSSYWALFGTDLVMKGTIHHHRRDRVPLGSNRNGMC